MTFTEIGQLLKGYNKAQTGSTKSPASFDPLATPDFFPTKIDAERQIIQFTQMSKDSFRQSTFLDRRIVRAGATTLMAEIPKLITRQTMLPLHFILHVAFCGSTLLARYLETVPRCLVLKEPGVLGQLSLLKDAMPDAADPRLWDEWFKVVAALLSRGYQEDLAVVVKAADMNNWMGSLFLDHDVRTKIIFLFIPLRTFLLQVLKADHRRQWLREHMRALRRPMGQVPFLSQIDAEELHDGQRAAAMWLTNAFLCRALLERPDSQRIILLDGECLISQPRQHILAAADHLGLIADEFGCAAVRELFPMPHHAKDKQLAYDASTRAAELAVAEARYVGEVAAAMSWASVVSSGWLANSPFPLE